MSVTTVPTVVVSPYQVVTKPSIGGHFWVYLQYVHALRQLGCDVYWLERVPRGLDSRTVDVFFERMERHGLAGRSLLYEAPSPRSDRDVRFVGTTPERASAVFDRADVLLNFHYTIDPAMLARFRRTALVDIDPGLLQFWMSRGQLAVADHDVYVTTGETVGEPGGLVPDCGVRWLHVRPVVCLDLWPYAYDPECTRFTSVSSWLAGEYVTERRNGRKKIIYENDKRISFLRFANLPASTACELELALFLDGRLDADDRALLEGNGWHIRHAADVAGSPEAYRSYIRHSRGEFSCAKPSCLAFQNAWVSDRTLCYLASGKPAVVQDTGPSSFLPTGDGLLRFSTFDEAADALAAVDARYASHCAAARGIAEEFFDAREVLAGLLEHVL